MNTRIVAADRKYYTDNGGSGQESARVVETLPCWLQDVVMTNFAGGAARRWLQVFDAAAIPANGSLPLVSIEVPDTMTGTFGLPNMISMTTGIVVACSETGPTLTRAVNDDGKFFVTWKRKA